MIDAGLKCPFCGGTVWIAVCDDEGNLHSDSYADDPWSGLSYGLMHGHNDVPEDEFCPIAVDDTYIGRYLFDDAEEAAIAWGFSNKMLDAEIAPCQIGDILWTCYKNQAIQVEVCEIKSVDKYDNTLHKSRRVGVRGHYMHGNYRRPYKAYFNWNSIGKTLVFTKEEAQKRVKNER